MGGMRNFNQPLQVQMSGAEELMAEVKMTQMHFNRMQEICFKRCADRIYACATSLASAVLQCLPRRSLAVCRRKNETDAHSGRW